MLNEKKLLLWRSAASLLALRTLEHGSLRCSWLLAKHPYWEFLGGITMKVALVCDWLTNVGGAERVLLALHQMYPEAPIYTSQYDPRGIDWFCDAEVRTGWMQVLPARLRRLLGPLRQQWFEHLDLSGYDVVISVTGAEAKAVKVPNGRHICYCHVPTQYYWQMYDEYVKNPGFGVLNWLVRPVFKAVVGRMRKADQRAAQGPDEMVTISRYAQELISRYYQRTSKVIHPPVAISDFSTKGEKSQEDLLRSAPLHNSSRLRSSVLCCNNFKKILQHNTPPPRAKIKDFGLISFDCDELYNEADQAQRYYVTTSRQVNWKRLDLAVEACVRMRRRLVVIGEGPEHERLMRLAGESGLVKFLPRMDSRELARWLAGARGYLFPSLEPFGIAPVEAMAAGCPVVAYGEGGARDYVKEGVNGVMFSEQSVEGLTGAMREFEKMEFDRAKVARSVRRFDAKRFERGMREVVKKYER